MAFRSATGTAGEGASSMDNSKQNRHRGTYAILIGAGVYLLLFKLLGLATLMAVLLVLLGLYVFYAYGFRKKGLFLLVVGILVLLGHHLLLILSLILISLGFFYIKSKQMHKNDRYIQKQKLLENIRWDDSPWVMRDMSLWFVVGEVHMDLSLAIIENKETTIMLQGIVGNIDLIVPEELGIAVESSVLFGQLDVEDRRETGMINKIVWQSPGFETSDTKVKLIISYVVGDVDITVV